MLLLRSSRSGQQRGSDFESRLGKLRHMGSIDTREVRRPVLRDLLFSAGLISLDLPFVLPSVCGHENRVIVYDALYSVFVLAGYVLLLAWAYVCF